MLKMNEVEKKQIQHMGEGLVVLIGKKVFPLVDISVSGISFQAQGFKVKDRVSMKVAQLDNLNDNVDCDMTVVTAGETVTRGQFYPTMKLMRYIVRHVSELTNESPRYVK
jgi:hypothetical protein